VEGKVRRAHCRGRKFIWYRLPPKRQIADPIFPFPSGAALGQRHNVLNRCADRHGSAGLEHSQHRIDTRHQATWFALGAPLSGLAGDGEAGFGVLPRLGYSGRQGVAKRNSSGEKMAPHQPATFPRGLTPAPGAATRAGGKLRPVTAVAGSLTEDSLVGGGHPRHVAKEADRLLGTGPPGGIELSNVFGQAVAAGLR
jgi:hypothetical protein